MNFRIPQNNFNMSSEGGLWNSFSQTEDWVSPTRRKIDITVGSHNIYCYLIRWHICIPRHARWKLAPSPSLLSFNCPLPFHGLGLSQICSAHSHRCLLMTVQVSSFTLLSQGGWLQMLYLMVPPPLAFLHINLVIKFYIVQITNWNYFIFLYLNFFVIN